MAIKENITQTLANKIANNIEKNNTSNLQDVWDTKTSGFGIRIGKTGATFIYKYRNKSGKSQTKTLGKIPDMTVQEARDLLDEFKPTIKSEDTATKKNKKFTVKDLCEKYLVEHQTRESTKKEDESRIKRHILPLLGNIPLYLLTAKDTMDAQKAIATCDRRIFVAGHKNPDNPHSYIKVTGGEGAAKRSMEMLKTILNFAEDQELIEKNPMNSRKFKKIKYNKKEPAYLEKDGYEQLGYLLRKYELKQHKNNVPQSVLFIKLAALTGCRKGELLNLTWNQIDFTNQCFVFPKTKTTGEQRRTFGLAAKQLLLSIRNTSSSNYIFPSANNKNAPRQDCLKALKEICKSEKNDTQSFNALSKLSLHGLRHSFSTMCNVLGISDVTREGLLGHKKGDVAFIYTHNTKETMIVAADNVSKSINDLIDAGYQKANLENNN